MVYDYSLKNLIKEYFENKEICDACMKGDSIEYNSNSENTLILGMGAAVFLIFLLISIIIWIWALIVLIKNWNRMPDVAKIVGVIGLFPILPFGSVITLICVYGFRKKNSRRSKR